MIVHLMGSVELRDLGGSVVVCLDEMQLVDVVDGVILSRLFGRLFDRGDVLLIATSNRNADALLEGGVRKEGLFFVLFQRIL